MIRQCAWCKKDLDPENKANSFGEITHGICSVCSLELSKGFARNAVEILDSIEEPVFLIDENCTVSAGNSSAQVFVGKDQDGINKLLPGDVFSCKNSFIDGGCGKSKNCQACAIRNSIRDTLQSGEEQQANVEIQRIQADGKLSLLNCKIATEKVAGVILLKVELRK